jgi:hypothetical protein
MGLQNNKNFNLSGRNFSSKEISLIQEMVEPIKNLSRSEIALTICENLNWKNPKGSLKLDSCAKALDKLEEMGYLNIPKRQQRKKPKKEEIIHTKGTEPKDLICASINCLGEISLSIVKEKKDVLLWNEYIDRYHYLKYKKPIGNFLRYFIRTKSNNEIIGCILFGSAAIALKARDLWIGWDKEKRKKNLDLIVCNTRFLILPWVKVENLASRVLSIVSKQVQEDWYDEHKIRPVLLETFVSQEYSGTCYQASNWINLGETSGRGKNDIYKDTGLSPKKIFVFPLQKKFREILLGQKYKKKRKIRSHPVNHNGLYNLWSKIGSIIIKIAEKHDGQWIIRNRILNTMILVLLIFRLIFSKNSKGYQTIIDEFWDNCKAADIPLPQSTPVRASAFTEARKKLDENIFKEINSKVIKEYKSNFPDNMYRWKGHEIYAVDGSKINLPLALKANGYRVPAGGGYYPIGLLSTLYQLKTRIPVDFSLTASEDERASLLTHIDCLNKGDLVVYDRGYLSFKLLHLHIEKGIETVFRVNKNNFKQIDEFGEGSEAEKIIDLFPCRKLLLKLKKEYQAIEWKPIKIRLIKYTIKNTTFCLATTLYDKNKYPLEDIADLYHGRWGIEVLYNESKNFIEIEDFHAKHERGVKQELYAHFIAITMNRLISNTIEDTFEENISQEKNSGSISKKINVNFKKSLSLFEYRIEEILLSASIRLKDVLVELTEKVKKCRNRIRLGRTYKRISHKVKKKWNARNNEMEKKEAAKRLWPKPVMSS